MARKIVFTSGKGGVGKTTVCANVGLCLAKQNLKVLLVDFDIGLNNLDVATGVQDFVQYDLIDVVQKKCRPVQALVQSKECDFLYILPSVHIFNFEQINCFKLKEIIDELANNFDYVLIDCPAGVEFGFQKAVECANEAIIITTPHISAIRNADRVASILNGVFNNVFFVINKTRNDLIAKGFMLKTQDVVNTLSLKFLGEVEESADLCALASVYGKTFAQGKDEKFFLKIAKNLHNFEYNLEIKSSALKDLVKLGVKRK